ncbi:hypothetical protein [Actinoplanes sp. NPDC051494]|uniref:hypothetical protein n=1 Tax=Actinoplanes sp. NPDC051494 TaxID=3363907 RepID=UPI00379867D1
MTTARRVLIVMGTLVMGYAVTGALTDHDVKFGVLLFLAGVLVLHDGVLLPVMIGLGVLVGRFLPARLHGPVRAALVVNVSVLLVGLPLALGYGRVADNPSVLPRHYGWGLAGILAVTWLVTAIVILVRRRAGSLTPRAEPPARRRGSAG